MKYIISILILSGTSLATTHADTVYKSVDKNGNVTYSTTPPDNSKSTSTVDIAPPPSEERVQAAQQRHDRNKETAEILDENRKKRDELTAEENRLKRERQKQMQQKQQAEENNKNQDYGYPYYPHPLPRRPIINRPVAAPGM